MGANSGIEKRCGKCGSMLKREAFGRDASRRDGLATVCSNCRSERHRATYKPKGRTSQKGNRFADVRDGDKSQARYRVNHLVKIGHLPNPNFVECSDCGHVGTDRRHEYDHHKGYSSENQEVVQVVCTLCHSERSRSRGEIVQTRNGSGKFTKKVGVKSGR